VRRDRVFHDIGKPNGLKHPQRLVIQRDRARLVINGRRALDHRDFQAIIRQQIGKDGANGSIADDSDVIPRVSAQGTRSLST
jgi:hypothetical protein